jgi:hypothetical protein
MMDLSFRVVDADDVLRIDAEGKVDLAASVAAARAISGYGSALPVLFDARRLQGRLSTLDTVELVKTMLAEPALRVSRKLAILARSDDQLERARFLEVYSRNRGIPIGAFVDYEEAVRWLNEP